MYTHSMSSRLQSFLVKNGENMKKPIRFLVAVFLALGSMITFSPREGRTREALSVPDDCQQGIKRHFVAAWEHVSDAVLLDEK